MEVALDTKNLDRLIKTFSKKAFVDIGIIGSKAAATDENGQSIVQIGAKHEFGAPEKHISRRSFIAFPIMHEQEKIIEVFKKAEKIYLEQGNAKKALSLVGIAGEAAIQEAFETGGFGTWAPLSEITVAIKGSDSILIDTGLLRKSIASKVGGV